MITGLRLLHLISPIMVIEEPRFDIRFRTCDIKKTPNVKNKRDFVELRTFSYTGLNQSESDVKSLLQPI